MFKLISRLSIVLIFAWADSGFAGPIYYVERSIGVGSVFGTIETDGTLGILSNANILDWSLNLSDGSTSFTLLGPQSGNNSELSIYEEIEGFTGLSATSSDLLFNFSNKFPAYYVLFQNPTLGTGINFWCLNDYNGWCSSDRSMESVGTTSNDDDHRATAARSGVTSIASSVSTPTTLSLIASAVAALGITRRKRANWQIPLTPQRGH